MFNYGFITLGDTTLNLANITAIKWGDTEPPGEGQATEVWLNGSQVCLLSPYQASHLKHFMNKKLKWFMVHEENLGNVQEG